jgi:hypothetical protein
VLEDDLESYLVIHWRLEDTVFLCTPKLLKVIMAVKSCRISLATMISLKSRGSWKYQLDGQELTLDARKTHK